jgi:hypothetical protein
MAGNGGSGGTNLGCAAPLVGHGGGLNFMQFSKPPCKYHRWYLRLTSFSRVERLGFVMFDPQRPLDLRLWQFMPWRRSDSSGDEAGLPEAGGRGAAFGIVLGLLIAFAFWAVLALVIF